MAESVSSWLAKAILTHDEKHGANLEQRTDRLKRLVQIKKFHTFRTTEDPRRQITGLISDRTHDLLVEFDVEATDRFESADTDLPQETLTSNLRSILMIRSYRWKLEPPNRRRSADGHLELPIVKMVILDFDLHSGNKNSPIYFEDTCEIGKGKNDGPVQKVLRKWYFGESNSDPSQPDKSFDISQPEAGPSRLRQSTSQQAVTAPPLPNGVILLPTFLDRFLAEDGAKRKSVIPEWIFRTSGEIQAALDEVQVFGLDFDTGDDVPAIPAAAAAQTASNSSQERINGAVKLDKGKQKEELHSSPITASRLDHSFPQTQYMTPPVPLGQRPRSTQTVTQPTMDSPEADDEESDGEIPIRPASGPATQRRRMFDPLAFSSQASEASEPAKSAGKSDDEEEEEIEFVDDVTTDSELLSDYERSARREKKRRLETGETQVKVEARDEPMQVDEESLPASDLVESYSLSKQFPSPGKRQLDVEFNDRPGAPHSPANQRRHPTPLPIVVGHIPQGGQAQENDSLGSNKTGSGGTQSLPTPPPSDDQPDIGGECHIPRVTEMKTEAPVYLSPPDEKRGIIRAAESLIADARDYLRIDMTIDGLTEASVKEYTRKVKERREATAKRRRESETPRNSDR